MPITATLPKLGIRPRVIGFAEKGVHPLDHALGEAGGLAEPDRRPEE